MVIPHTCSRFGGYALSDADWNRARDTLMERMGAERRAMIDGPKGNFWSVAYDTPKKLTDRRNEVWIPIQEGAPVLRQEKTTLESTVLKTKNVSPLLLTNVIGFTTWGRCCRPICLNL